MNELMKDEEYYKQFRVRASDKKIYGGVCDQNQMLPLRYPEAWALYLKANTNHWMPSSADFELDLQGKQYEHLLTPQQYICTELGVAWHMIVSQVCLELVPILYRHTTAPECRQYMLRMMEEDSIAILLITKHLPLTNLKQGVIQNWISGISAALVQELQPHMACETVLDYSALLSMVTVLKTCGSRAHYNHLREKANSSVPVHLARYIGQLKRDLDTQVEFLNLMVFNLVQENPNLEEFVGMALDCWTNASDQHWDGHNLGPKLQHHRKKDAKELKAILGQETSKKSETSLTWN